MSKSKVSIVHAPFRCINADGSLRWRASSAVRSDDIDDSFALSANASGLLGAVDSMTSTLTLEVPEVVTAGGQL